MAYNQPPSYNEAMQPPQPGFIPATHYPPPQVHSQQPYYAPLPQQQPPQPQTVIIQTTTTRPVVLAAVGSESTYMRCPSCHAEIRTTVRTEPSMMTHIAALILCLFVCWPCVCLPYCMDSCQNANHYCPNCNAFIGTYQN